MKRKIYKAEVTAGIGALYPGLGEGGYVKNMIVENGALRKRNGWKTLYNFRGYDYEPHRINGIYEYRGEAKSCLLVHAGEALYECDYDLTSIERVPLDSGAMLKDERSGGHMYGGVLWITGMDKALIYDGESVKEMWNSPFCYVPVTSTDINEKNTFLPPKAEDAPSRLTDRRINTLHAEKNKVGVHRFLLDTPLKFGTPFKLTAAFRVRKSDEEVNNHTSDYVGTDMQGNEVNVVVYKEIYTECIEEGVEITSDTNPVDGYGREISVGNNFTFVCYVANGNELCLTFDAVSPDTKDNISVEFTAQTGENQELCMEDMAVVTPLSGGSIAAVSNGTGKLLLNVLRDGKFYMPTDGEVAVDAEKITALLPSVQGSLAIYTESKRYAALFESEGKREIFSGADGCGCFSPFAVTRLNGEDIVYNSHGIFGARDSVTRTSISTSQKDRGAPIQTELDKMSVSLLELGSSCVHKEKYYLFLNGIAYVAKKIQGRDDFVWQRLENCSARVASSIKGALYMGRENGDVAVFDSGYTDRRDYFLRERERDFLFQNDEGKTTVSFNYAIDVKDGDKISLQQHYALFARALLNHKTSQLHLSLESVGEDGKYAGPCPGDQVLLVDTDGYAVYEGGVLDFNPSEQSIYCGNLGLGQDTELFIYVKRDEGTRYTLKTVKGVKQLYFGQSPLVLFNTEIENVYVRNEKEIECEFQSPVTDLNGEEKRTIVGIRITPSSDSRGKIEVGYKTDTSTFSKELTLGSQMDFCGLDFKDFSFNTGFKGTIDVRCLERNFDRVSLWLRSKEGKSLGIESMSLIYY